MEQIQKTPSISQHMRLVLQFNVAFSEDADLFFPLEPALGTLRFNLVLLKFLNTFLELMSAESLNQRPV